MTPRSLHLVLALLLVAAPAGALRDPAMVYCTELGYEFVPVMTDSGQVDSCKLPDGRYVGTWNFLAGISAPEAGYCARQGYKTTTIRDCDRCSPVYSCTCAVCILRDGSEVEVTTLMALDFRELGPVSATCGDGICTVGPENYTLCPADCPSGGGDICCDGVQDGICDPDCRPDRDPDCPVETEETAGRAIPGFAAIGAATALAFATCVRKR
jgi:putative hemolysin